MSRALGVAAHQNTVSRIIQELGIRAKHAKQWRPTTTQSSHAHVTLDALKMAVKRRNPPRGLVHHSGRGVQYARCECRALLATHGMEQSMSRAGDCSDNAMMESLWSILKKELIHAIHFQTREEARGGLFDWIEVWYQRKRIHGSIGYVSPEAFEASARVG